MFRPARPSAPAEPAAVPSDRLAGPRGKAACWLLAAAAAAACGCCSSPYGGYGGGYGQPYGGGVPGYYGPPAGGQQFSPQPQYAPQPVPGTVPPGTILGPPSNGGGSVPPLSPPSDPYGSGGGYGDGFGDDFNGEFDTVPPYESGGFGDTPTGGGTAPPPANGGGDPFYSDGTGGFGNTPTNTDTGVPPLSNYPDSSGGFDGETSPNPAGDGFEGFDPPPPGAIPDGFTEPTGEDFGRNRPAAPHAPAALARAATTPLPGGPAPTRDPRVRPAAAQARPAEPRPAPPGPRREVTGVIEHDAAANVWTLTYTLHPKPTDRFGGVLTLADGGRLAGWKRRRG